MKEYWEHSKTTRIATDILVDIFSGLILGIAFYNFAADEKFPLTGVSGIAMIFYQFFGWKIGVVSMLLNIPIILGTCRILGRKFMLRSFRTLAVQTIVMDFITPCIPVAGMDNTLLNALVVAVLCGVGYALVFMRKSSTGGFDFIIMAIRRKHPHLSLGRITLAVDAVVIVMGSLAYGKNTELLCYGILISYITAKVMDNVMIAADTGKLCLIITNSAELIATAIDRSIERGCTIFTAKGGYRGDERQVLMCACSNKQMYQVSRVTKIIDEDALIIITDSREIYGNGFKRFKP